MPACGLGRSAWMRGLDSTRKPASQPYGAAAAGFRDRSQTAWNPPLGGLRRFMGSTPGARLRGLLPGMRGGTFAAGGVSHDTVRNTAPFHRVTTARRCSMACSQLCRGRRAIEQFVPAVQRCVAERWGGATVRSGTGMERLRGPIVEALASTSATQQRARIACHGRSIPHPGALPDAQLLAGNVTFASICNVVEGCGMPGGRDSWTS